MTDDFKANARTAGSVAAGGETAGVIGKKNDVDWFAVELVAGRTYVIDLEGDGGGALDAMLRGLYDAAGRRIAGTRNNDGGEGSNARLTFTATEDGTHYIAARGQGGTTGAYTVRVTESDTDATPAGAAGLGDLAGQDGARARRDAVDGAADGADYYRFTLGEARTVKLSLRDQDADAPGASPGPRTAPRTARETDASCRREPWAKQSGSAPDACAPTLGPCRPTTAP